jgi:hypothetical protein
MSYAHLGLRNWPFRIVPEPEFCDFLADRGELRKDVEAVVTSLVNRPTSDIQLIWSWYGAGKTHTLYYLANRCSRAETGILPIYAEMPREAKSFVDLYKTSIAQIPQGRLIDAGLEHVTRPAPGAFVRAIDPDLHNALTQTALGDRPRTIQLTQWLQGNSLAASAYRELGVGGRINGTEKSAGIFGDVISLLAPRSAPGPLMPATYKRILWIIDEVQRVEDFGSATQRSILSGLVGVFNRCATGLTILLSYTGTPREKSLPKWIPPDLADRIGLERPMVLPPLRSDEATTFVREVLEHFRMEGQEHLGAFFPFEPDAITELLKALGRHSELKPRAIMEALDASLRNLEPAIRTGELRSIGVAELKKSLEKLALDWGSSSRGKSRDREG